MNAVPPTFAASMGHDAVRPAPDAADATGLRWTALAEAGDLVAALAGFDREGLPPGMRGFPAQIRQAEPWRRERAEAGVADLAAVMEPGIAALLAVNARGVDPRPAATALWREFAAAREAILALLPPPGA